MTLPNATSHTALSIVRLYTCLQGGVGSVNVDGYAFRFTKQTGADSLAIERMTNAVFTGLAGGAVALEIDSGDKIGAEVLSNGTLNFWVDDGAGWDLVATASDTTYGCIRTNIGLDHRVGHSR
jgi:hypothetical protein